MSLVRRPRRKRRLPAPGADRRPRAWRRLAVRLFALAVLAVAAVLVGTQLTDLRGELAFARFHRLVRLAEQSRDGEELTRTVAEASVEADLVMHFADGDADALWNVAVACLSWAGEEQIDPILRLQIAQRAVGAAAIQVRAAPADYEAWLLLARAQAALGLVEQADACFQRAQELAPPGKELAPSWRKSGEATS